MEQASTDLLLRARDGNRSAARAVVESLRPEIDALVRALADSGLPGAVIAEELAFAIACAVRRFDPGGEVRFVAYARHWMRACVVERQLRRELGRRRRSRARRRQA